MKKIVTLLDLIFLLFCWSFPFVSANENANSPVRIMNYNIRHGIGNDGSYHYDYIVNVIKKANPDIVALQEIDHHDKQGLDVNKFLSENCMMFLTFEPLFSSGSNAEGLAILSKESPVSHEMVKLPGNKAMLMAEFKDYFVCSVRLSTDLEEQKASVPVILQALKKTKKTVFIAGDMNSTILSPSQIAIQNQFKVLNNYNDKTLAVENEPNIPYDCVDFIYGSNTHDKYAVLKSEVIPLEKFDHFPVLVDIRIAKPKKDIFLTKPYLQRPLNNEITICWETSVPTFSWVEYGKKGNLDQKKYLYIDGQMLCNNTRHHFTLSDIESGVDYSYRICSQEILYYGGYKKVFGHTAVSDVYNFSLPEQNKSKFTALVFNDMHNNSDLIPAFRKIIDEKKIDYDFVLYNGDCMDAPADKTVALRVLNELNTLAKAEEKPYFFIRGNHEIRGAYSIIMHSLFEYITETTYGSFTWGNTRFVVLDCGEDKPDSTWVYYGLNDFDQLRKDQMDFLMKEKESQAFKNAAHRILVHHIPIFGMPKSVYNPCFDLWAPVLRQMPFDFCFNAHTHHFKFMEKDGSKIPFPCLIGGGRKISDAFMLILEVNNDHVFIKALDTAGKETFSFQAS